MAKGAYIEAVARHISGELHQSSTGFRCRCGGCRHHIISVARRAGIDPQRLAAALAPERSRPVETVRRRARSAPLAEPLVAAILRRLGLV